MKIKLIDKSSNLPNCWKQCGASKEEWDKLQTGEEIDVKVIGIDRKTHNVMVSHKALETPPDSATGSREIGDAPTKTTLGDLLREKMRDDEEKNK